MQFITHQAAAFFGPVQRLAGGGTPCPASRVAEALRFRQISFAAPQGLFSALAVIDVRVGSIPFYNPPLVIHQRFRAVYKPAILPVVTPHAGFQFKWLAGSHGDAPLVREPSDVFLMNRRLPA